MADIYALFGLSRQGPQPIEEEDDDHDHYYVLDADRQPVRVGTLEEHMAWSNSGVQTLVGETDLGEGWQIFTSFDGTVWAPEDKESAAPLFRTLVIMAGDDDDYVDAYPTWEAAEEGHRRVVEEYKKRLGLA